MRITKQTVRAQCVQLNTVLGRPAGQFDIGHFNVDKNHMGYQLEEEMNGFGAVHAHSNRITVREMYYLLDGMIAGAHAQSRRVNPS